MIRSVNNSLCKCFFILLTFLVSCDQSEVTYTYFDNGKVKERFEMKNKLLNGQRITHYQDSSYMISYWRNGLQHGITKVYFPNKKLQSLFTYANGRLNGNYIIYFNNGNISQVGTYSNGIKTGNQHQYFKDEKGKLWRTVQFLDYQGKQIVSGYVVYNKQGKIIEESSRVLVKAARDTIEVGEQIELEIKLLKPAFVLMRVFIGNFDAQFYINDSLKADTIVGKDQVAKIFFTSEKPGPQYIRGLVEDYKVLQKGDTAQTMAQHIYFEHKIYIRKKKS